MGAVNMMTSKYFGISEFNDTLHNVGDVWYDMNKSFTSYAGFLEGLMQGMFYELDDEQKVYYLKRAKSKLLELEMERLYKV